MDTLNSGKKCSGYLSVTLLLCILSIVPFDASAQFFDYEYRTYAGTYGIGASDQKFSDSPIDSYIDIANGTNSGFAHGWVSSEGDLYAESSGLASEGGGSSVFYAAEVYFYSLGPFVSNGETVEISFDWFYNLELSSIDPSGGRGGPFVGMTANIYDKTTDENLLNFRQKPWLDDTGDLSDSGSVFASYDLIAGHEYEFYFVIDAYSDFNRYTEVTSAYAYGSFTNFQITAVSAVPVPAALWLFGSGLLSMVYTARRNQKSGVRPKN